MPELLNTAKLVNVTRLFTLEEVDSILLPWLYVQKEFGWDIETTFEKEFFNRKTRTVQFGTKERQYLIDLLDFTDLNPKLLYDCQGWYGATLADAPKLQTLMKK